MLELRGVRKRYGRASAVLERVDLTLRAGEVVAVVGGNGAGKSTLLRLMVGLSTPSSGTVSGRPRIVGYVPDRFPPNERLCALAYLTHMGRVRGLGTAEARDTAGALLERLDLVGGRDAPLRTLSKGNAQKVALAQALLVTPHLLVLDEPWSGLDASAHGMLGELIGEVAAVGGTVVYTDHEESVSDVVPARTLVVADGHVTVRDPSPRVPSDPHTELELVLRRGPRVVGEVDWSARPGVRAVERDGDVTSVVVDPRCSDSVLLAALDQGWSVACVGPRPLRGGGDRR